MSAAASNVRNKLRRAARVILVGPPGSGKGTQSGRLLEHFKMSAISSGDILRENVRSLGHLYRTIELIAVDSQSDPFGSGGGEHYPARWPCQRFNHGQAHRRRAVEARLG
jgi:hypothetical protein